MNSFSLENQIEEFYDEEINPEVLLAEIYAESACYIIDKLAEE